MKKILIVDDSANVRDNLEQGLANLGYQVVTAANGKLGLAKADSEAPDLIITDHQMPEMDGITMCEHLAQRQRKVPIIVLTAESNKALKARAKSYGVVAWILKPVQISTLAESLEQIFQRYTAS